MSLRLIQHNVYNIWSYDMMQVTITTSSNNDKQFKAVVKDRDPKNTFDFGQAGASDMTQHGN